MRLTVLSVAYPFARVDADPLGGAEQVLAQLDRALVAAGARSVVLAQAGSQVAGELVDIPVPPGSITDDIRALTHARLRRRLSETIARVRPDVIHLHGVDFASYLPPPGAPALVTLHLPLDMHPPGALPVRRLDTWLVPVSDSQARTAPRGLDLLRPIPNGVDVDAFAAERPRKRDFAVALGRLCPEKGFHLALDAARLAGAPLLLAGDAFPYPAHQAYLAEEIRPRLDARRRWLGPVTGAAKRRLLAAARCVLVPSLCAETSSLVVREALAAGTPVIAFASGALPEAVDHGRTGFLVESVDAMAAAILRAEVIDPGTCRAAARERFDVRTTTAAYLDLYARLAEPARVRPRAR
jgi:glycosyltransferase involved in cell wall biosynthesis